MADSHFNDPYNPNANENAGSGDADKFKNIVQALSIANQYNGQTLLGYVLGRYLKGVYNRWQNGQDRRKKTAYYKSQGWIHADGTLYSPQEIEEAKQHAYRKAMQVRNAEELFGIDPNDPFGINQRYGRGTPQERAMDWLTSNAVNNARAKMKAEAAANTPEAQQFYADQKAHPEWFEGDYYVGWDPAEHEKFRAEHPDYMKSLAAKTAQPQAAQPAPSSSSSQPTIPAYQANALQQTMNYTPTQPYFSADTGKAASGQAANPTQWDKAEKPVTNESFSDMVKKYGSLNNALGGWNGGQQNTFF